MLQISCLKLKFLLASLKDSTHHSSEKKEREKYMNALHRNCFQNGVTNVVIHVYTEQVFHSAFEAVIVCVSMSLELS